MEIKIRRSILQFKNCLIILLSLSCITVSLQAQDEHDSPDKDHSQKAVLVTGASTGIGRNIAQRLASEGYFVYAGARKEPAKKKTCWNSTPLKISRPYGWM